MDIVRLCRYCADPLVESEFGFGVCIHCRVEIGVQEDIEWMREVEQRTQTSDRRGGE